MSVETSGGSKQPASAAKPDVRVAIVGNVDSGKSTLIGVLANGGLDNGRGKARAKVFLHRHEASNGRTSCISQHILGFDKEKQIVHQPVAASATAVQKNKGWREVVSKSESILTLVDLAGHEKYLKTTIAGLTGCFPDYAIVVIGANMGITKMTKEHLGVAIALGIPVICVVTKIDIAPPNVLAHTKKILFRILKSSGARKKPFEVRNDDDIRTVLSTKSKKIAPVFLLSTVTGENLDLLKTYLAHLKQVRHWDADAGDDDEKTKQDAPSSSSSTPSTTTTTAASTVSEKQKHSSPVEFRLDESFVVTGVGLVVSGTVERGHLKENTVLALGPFHDGGFHRVLVKTIHCKRVPVAEVTAGMSCAIAVRSATRKMALRRSDFRHGMVMVEPQSSPRSNMRFLADVKILHHPSTIKCRYQAVIHCGMIRQTAELRRMNRECLRTGDQASVEFRFIQRPEYMHVGSQFIFREGSTKGLGRVTRLIFTDEDEKEVEKKLQESLEAAPEQPLSSLPHKKKGTKGKGHAKGAMSAGKAGNKS